MISVIITVYDRLEFYAEAIKSINVQSCKDGLIEIIVVSNIRLENLKSDRFPIIYIESLYQNLSSKIVEAVKKSSCPIIAFLEDDDLWDTDKAINILETFAQDKSIDFYHNGYIFFRNQNNISGDVRKFSKARSVKVIEAELIRTNTKIYNYVYSKKASYNLSSMAIRKDIFLKGIEVFFAAGNDYIDNFLFFEFITWGRKIAIESKLLTYIRIHPNNHSGMNLGKGISSYETALNFLLSYSRDTLVLNNVTHLITRNRLDVLMKSGTFSKRSLIFLAGNNFKVSLICKRFPDIDLVLKVLLAFLSFQVFKSFITKYHLNS